MRPAAGMTLNTGLSVALLVTGIALLVLGAMAAESISSDLARLLTGKPSDKTVWLLVGGGLAVIGGLAGLARAWGDPRRREP